MLVGGESSNHLLNLSNRSENVTSRDAATSPEPLSLKKNLTCSANSLLQQGKISILTYGGFYDTICCVKTLSFPL